MWRTIRRVWATLGTLAFVLFAGWSLLAFRATPAGRAAARSDARVAVTHDDATWRFVPTSRAASTEVGLLFFPGALVNPLAYAPIARAAAESGYVATIVELPRRGAFGGADEPALYTRARAVLWNARGPRRWVVAGHSRGAVVAVNVVAAGPEGVAGLVIIGSSHPRDVSLASLRAPVTKVVGTRDGLASPEEVRANAHLLPAGTRWVWIEGGNHSQFGWYGFQPGDNRARVSAESQRATTVGAVLAMLRDLSR